MILVAIRLPPLPAARVKAVLARFRPLPPTSSSSVVPPQNTNTADSDGKGDDDDHDGDDGKKGKDDNKKRSGITRHSYVTFHLFFFLVLNNCTSSRQINVGQTRCESFHNYRARFR